MHRLSQIGTVVVRRGGQPARSTPKNALLVDPLLAAGKTRVSLQAEDTTTWIDIPNALIPGLVERLVKASSEEGV